MRFTSPVLCLLLSLKPSSSFTINHHVPVKALISNTQLHSANDGNEPGKKKNQQHKKRRFAQDVDPVVEFAPPTFQQQPLYPAKENTKKPSEMNVASSKSRSKNMVQNGKSIDELENIMSKRWGLSGDDWKVDFNEWEVADEEGNGTNDSKHAKESVSSARKVRSKPVLDPWEKEERRRNYAEKAESEKTFDDTNASAFQSAKSRQDAVLERVKRNQARLQTNKDGEKTSQTTNVETDFYDEDDEGYEPSVSNNDEDEDLEDEDEDFYNNIISPKPAGGLGSSKSSADQGGFFFSEGSPSSVTEIESAPELSLEDRELKERRAEKKKKDKDKKAARKQMADENGNDMFLSLDEAQRQAEILVKADFGDEDIPETMVSWEDVGITNQLLLGNLENMGCDNPLSVQDKACPSIVSGNDVLVSTHTGSGKTLAFLAPLAEQLLVDKDAKKSDVKVIVIAPGRELASQIVAVARELFQGTGLTAALAIGGTPFGRNFENIRKNKPDFIIGTPGRIAELVVGKADDKGGKLKIANLQSVVLDECDALLEYEPHRDPTQATMEVLKRRHGKSLQSILCSATAGDLLGKSLLDDFLRPGYAHAQSDESDKLITSGNSKKIRVSRTAIHGVVRVDHQRFALETLRKVLYTDPAPQQALIFVDNSRRVGVVVEKLAEIGIIAAPLHGGQGSEKGDRAEVNKALREGFVGIVVATEMAARGIDAPYLTHVINLDLPTDASHYAHRAGRCGRGGRPGVVVNIAVGAREKNVPMKFAEALDIEMYLAEPQGGKLAILESKKAE